MRYKSICTMSFEFEFDEEGDLILLDQAHDAAMNLLPSEIWENLLDFQVFEPVKLPKPESRI